ncbi:HoxN/HupN/NixA family nickel/cobalt transporter [Acidisoma cladoniae]|jgi:high-affinity nickel-transport protein|uniref:HoxN/HupN/NixA family nickel/cobalt transporter n=1 Tax=Acidisoma cladoniae TaxID=3040935 RepID=UPI00254CA952|nr:HoxN/HupN/NixA family nickel/cobalt transporter [Acidisoma sp. PAMC 29798]
MLRILRHIFNDASADVRGKVIGIYVFLIATNIGAWVWAIVAFRSHPVLLGTALLAYSFGLRHAVDADHIAAIDNVTRKLMQDGKRPVTVGFFFSIGHSLVLLIGTAIIAFAVVSLQTGFDSFNNVAGTISTLVSGLFLLVMAAMNLMIARSVYRTYRHVRRGGHYDEDSFNILLNNRGLIARLLRPLFRLVNQSWHMLPVGFLFGLGFDTVTEVSLLTVAATEASKGLPVWSILAFPALFCAGMSLIDTTDGILMLGAYGWAFVKPIRKLYYNLTITLVSAIVAILIGGIETLGLIGGELNLQGWFWDRMNDLNENFGLLGYGIIGVFAAAWIISFIIYRVKKLDDVEISQPGGTIL